VHGPDGQGNHGRQPPVGAKPVPEHAAQVLVDLARANPGEIDLVAIGPLTNLALALGLEPNLPRLFRSVTVMGGAADVPGNATPVAEANIFHDPEAATAVFAASWPLTLVPLDVTMKTLLTEEHRDRLVASDSEVARYAAAISDFYFDFNADASFDQRLSPMHDALAVAIAMGTLQPTVAPNVSVVIDTSDGPGRGQTICDTRHRYRDFRRDSGPVRLVLEVEPGFPDTLVNTLTV
jgi:purine nucleosidase